MNRIVILHTNDIHGRVEGLARIATLVAQYRAENASTPVLYFDLGDSEEYASRLSGLTKGAAMHRLLHAAGCDATVVGNAILARHGPGAVSDETVAAPYPHLLANVRFADGRPIPGTEPTALITAGELALGLIGVTADFFTYERFFGLQTLEPVPIIRELAAQLRGQGADAIILLSHLGIDADREVAAALDDELALILGGHTHTLLPEGEWVEDLLIAQAGEYGQHLGKAVLEWDGKRLRPVEASVQSVSDDISLSAGVQATITQIEKELEAFMGEIICELPQALDLALDRECALGNLLADALRDRTGADVALAVPGPTFIEGLPAGPLRRETLWAASPGTGNPGVTELTGAQLLALLKRGRDPEFAAEKHQALRGHGRGLMHLSGAVFRNNQLLINRQAPDPERRFRVAASDFELEPTWGYADEAWGLTPDYEVEVIMREVLEDYLRSGDVFPIEMGRAEEPVAADSDRLSEE